MVRSTGWAGRLLLGSLVALAAACPIARAANPPRKPNIVIIIADDLGYGDIGCYGATKVKTPNLDRLAAAGLRFSDGHCTSGTCTPSRYSLMTGEYAWRKKGTGILPGDASLIIDTEQATVASTLKAAGYATGCVGKWHLGLGARGVKIDWNGEIKPGPNELGFDFSYIIPATGDRVPCVYVENHRVAGVDPNDPIAVSYGIKVGTEPTGKEHPELLKMKFSHGHDDTIVNGISRIGFMAGGASARWTDETIADTLTSRAVGFIEQNKDKPFFLYFATHDIHVPRVPGPKFAGSSGCGVRGDVIQELDGSVGEVLAALDRLKLADDTLLIFTSDNGPVVDDGYADGAVEHLNGHVPAGPFRGGKYSNYEGGTRVPFLVRWPGRVKAGSTSDALVCQVDFVATFAKLAGADVSAGAAPDSLDAVAALLGEAPAGRDHLIEQATGPLTLAIRRGPWKYLARAIAAHGEGPATRGAKPPQAELYNLVEDPGEKRNVIAEHPEIARDLAAELDRLREQGRTRPLK